jgi:asparagine synthase (glutamine-hydrolysing)
MPAAAESIAADVDAVSGDWVLTLSADGRSTPAFHGAAGPALARDARYTAFFDGTIHNAVDLRKELALPLAASAAEILLAAWRRWDERALERLKGIFVLAVHDRDRSQTVLARDPLGVYPAFYAEIAGSIHVATSVAPLLAHPAVPRRVNRLAIADHLCHRWPDPQETYFEAIRRLPPAHRARFSAGGADVRLYWDPDPIDQPMRWASDDELAGFEQVLDRAVGRSLAFGKAGIFLSGGFDSISVAAFATDIAARSGQPSPLALSLGFPDPTCNEEIVQRGVAKQLGLEQVFLSFWESLQGRGLIESAVDMIGTWPVPMLNLWNPAYTALAQHGKAQGCRTILTGNGGDEWLAVSPFLSADLMRSGDVAGFIRFAMSLKRSYKGSRLSLWRGAVWTFGIRPLLSSAVGAVAPEWWHHDRERRLVASTPSWLAPDKALRAAMDARAGRNVADSNPPNGFYRRDTRTALDHPLMAIELEEHFELGRRLGQRILHPYWDVDLVDLLLRIPPPELNQGGRAKGIVRSMLARRFPDLGFERHKKVTATSFYHRILLDEGPKILRAQGGPRELSRLEIVDREVLESTLQTLFAGSQPQQLYRIWDVLGLEAWLRAQAN